MAKFKIGIISTKTVKRDIIKRESAYYGIIFDTPIIETIEIYNDGNNKHNLNFQYDFDRALIDQYWTKGNIECK